ncbi:YfjI family protein [Solibacillus sp. CAU 1738]|uniref:YfjI family protein n=1 Tax=Solibacillus sp. CAU 1738 TaxID=3140363 RepID=UPI0032613C37
MNTENHNKNNIKANDAPIGESFGFYHDLKRQVTTASITEFEWEDPIEFDEIELETFDISIFPDFLQNTILAVSNFTQTPVDLPAMCLLGALSTALQKKFSVEPLSGWHEPLNTYTAILMGSSNRKSAVFNFFMSPIIKLESQLIDTHKSINAEVIKDLRLLEKRIDNLENKYARTGDKKTLDELQPYYDQKENLSITSTPALLLDNSTEEAIVSRLVENKERISIASSEGDLFERIKFFQKNDASKVDVYLKCYSGDPLRNDRISRSTERLIEPLLTICISAQPTVIQDMPQKIIDRGLIPRFLISVPKDFMGERDVFNASPIPIEIEERYNNFIYKLLNFEKQHPISIQLGENAYKILKQFEFEVEKAFLPDQIYYGQLRGWGGKIVGNLLRIAGLLHVSKHALNANSKEDIPTVIDAETLVDALKLKAYFDAHTEKAFGIMRNNVSYDNAKFLLKKILEAFNKLDSISIPKQEIWQNTKKTFATANHLDLTLKTLQERGYIKMDKGGKSGQREFIVLNPKIVPIE